MQNTSIQFETLNPAVVNYIKDLESSVNKYKQQYFELKEKYDVIMYQKYCRSAERMRTEENYPSLFVEETENTISLEPETEKQEIKSYTRKKPGRKPINPNIPRVDVIIEIPESERKCACNAIMTKIGEEISEKIEIIPQTIKVKRIRRFKYACRHCEGTENEDEKVVKTAPVPPCMIPKSMATASLLSHIMIQKYQDHLPFYRQQTLFSRFGIEISRQDMSNWQQQVYEKLLPLFTFLKDNLKNGPVIRMDETTVQVMGEEGRSDIDKSYMWLARGGPPDKTVVLYKYKETRAGYNAKEILEGYTGYLQTDGYSGYDAAVAGIPEIIQVGCFAHARRKFFEASKVTKTPQSAEEGIKYIRKLYDLENDLRKEILNDSEFVNKRKERAVPILSDFRAWLNKRANEVLPSGKLGEAVAYTLKQWDKLVAYLESPYLTPDNNAAENAIRPFVLGRKNWLFNKSPKGAESSCGIYSLIETAKQNGIEPFKYLHQLFEDAPLAVSTEDWEKLLPWNIFKN